ncbi:MAG: hypothetical protein R3C97_18300 [Geminicoccaceae bacterium]
MLVGLIFLIPVYYVAGMLLLHRVDDDATFRSQCREVPQGGSRAVAVATALIEREVNTYRW